MKYDYLGRTGLRVSKLTLGTMNFGWKTSEDESFRIMDKALDLDINFFDTADVYGTEQFNGADGHPGLTEEILGRWFAQGGQRREKVILATKTYMRLADPILGVNDNHGNSAYKMRRHLDDSLRRLQTDHIDVYLMHHMDEHLAWPEAWDAYQSFILNGKVTYAGSSNFGARHLYQAQWSAEKKGMLGLAVEQCQYSLRRRLPEIELLPAAKELGIGIMVWGPLDAGKLSGKIVGSGENVRTAGVKERLSETELLQLTEYGALCKELGESEAVVSLAWLLHNPAVTTVVIGPRTVEQLESAARAVDLELSEETLKKIDAIFPGYKTAPVAYGW